MKYLSLFLICTFFFASKNVHAQGLYERDFSYINYMTDPDDAKVIGEGTAIQEKRAINSSFDELIVGNGMQAFITSDDTKEIQVVAQENVLPLISSEVVDNKLIFRLTASMETNEGIKLYIPIGEIAKINIKEGGYLYFNDSVVDIDLLLQSGSTADCNIVSKNFSCTVMGGSRLNLEGDVSEAADIFVKGGSVLKGKKFECTKGNITALGASKCSLKVTEFLDARVENYSTLKYAGSPEISNKKTHTKGKIRRNWI